MKFSDTFLNYTKRERIAIILLSSLLLLFFISDIFFHRIFPEKDFSIPADSLVFYKQMLVELEEEMSIKTIEYGRSYYSKKDKNQIHDKVVYKEFDPNRLDLDSWIELGFSKKQAESILRYKKSIGKFDNNEDLASCFVVSEKKYNELEPFIKIENEYESRISDIETPISENKESKKLAIELNSTDSINLLKLKGIGPFYAGRIISYRNSLGGFISKTQLLEIWKFDTLKLAGISDHILVDTSNIERLKLNSDSVEVFYVHPYIDWNTARAIVQYRAQHGSYSSKEDLLDIVIIEDSLYLKILPYISIE